MRLESLQQIFYGAPGTGKSHIIKKQTKGKRVIRTTFHPDSDYSTFVGAYKPTTKEMILRDLSGHVVMEKGGPITEEKIVYEFVCQAFLRAYINAWKAYADAQQGEVAVEQYLVIEEINRGNCAQIFGDLFQLLDRNDDGFSDYPIMADNDMKKQLGKAFAGLDVPQRDAINALYDDDDIVGQVLEGDVLLLPNNLYIWATMNTSDQSLFPIDSAFKRRWDWRYMPIHNANMKWRIVVDGAEYDWWQFLTKVNEYIGSTTNSEDKKLGYFFCKPKNGKIDAETFVGKVIFYLWNDVFKDYGFDGMLFQTADGSVLTFDKFYGADANTINEANVAEFLKNLGVEELEFTDEIEDEENGKSQHKRRYDVWVEGVPFHADGLTRAEMYLNVLKAIDMEKVLETAQYAANLSPRVRGKNNEFRNTAYRGQALVSSEPYPMSVPSDGVKTIEQNGKTYYVLSKLNQVMTARFLGTIAKRYPELNIKVDYSVIEEPQEGDVTNFSVEFDDGTKCLENTAVKTFVQAIEHIGIERVLQLQEQYNDIKINKIPLIGTEKHPTYHQQKLSNGMYLIVHCDNRNKGRMLERIDKYLHIGLTVNVPQKETKDTRSVEEPMLFDESSLLEDNE